MRTITEWEVEEFIDEVVHRPTQWLGRDKLWVRKRNGENQLAVKFKNGLPEGMSTVHVAKLNGPLTQPEIEYYVEWMMKKFTGYGFRLEVEGVLRSEGVDEAKIEHIAHRIATPRGFKSKYLTAVLEQEKEIARAVDEIIGVPAQLVEAREDAPRLGVEEATKITPPVPTPPARSKYLAKLLKEGGK